MHDGDRERRSQTWVQDRTAQLPLGREGAGVPEAGAEVCLHTGAMSPTR
jgi:hypothetical protein